MFFRVTSPVANKEKYNFWVLHGARLAVITYRIKPAQKKLNDYLWKNFGVNLKSASLMVIANCRVQKNKSGELIITFPSKKINNLAAIITYGDGKVQGCSILKEAFGRY